jgi:hypothetical protein
MIKLKLRPGEYVKIGDCAKVFFAGGSANKGTILVETLKDVQIVRSKNDHPQKPQVTNHECEQQEAVLQIDESQVDPLNLSN